MLLCWLSLADSSTCQTGSSHQRGSCFGCDQNNIRHALGCDDVVVGFAMLSAAPEPASAVIYDRAHVHVASSRSVITACALQAADAVGAGEAFA